MSRPSNRRYGQWAGNPRGFPEDEGRCVEEVYPAGRSIISYQCSRKRGHGEGGLYCYQHSRDSKGIRPIRKEK